MTPKIKGFLLVALLIPCWVIAAQYEIDLVNIYKVVEFARADLARVYGYNPGENGTLGRFFYGPISVVIFWPLASVPFVVAKWFWIGLQTFSYVIFWVYLYKLYPILNEKRVFWGWLLVFILAINPIHNNYQSNNLQLMIMAALVVAEYWTRKNEALQILAGLLVALVASIKVFPLFIAVYYYLTRGRAVREGLMAGFFLAVAGTVAFFGFQDAVTLHRDFVLSLTTYDSENSLTGAPDILCLPSLLARWLPAEIAGMATKVSILSISALFFAWAWWTERKTQDVRVSIHGWALACALTAFLNPSTRPHYFILYIPAAVSVLEVIYASASQKLMTAGLVISTLLIAFTVEGVVGKTLNNRFEGWSLPTFGFILLTGILMVALKRRLATTTPAVT